MDEHMPIALRPAGDLDATKLINTIFSLSKDIRYVAIYSNNELVLSSKSGMIGASSSESDKYEELIVNPTLLTLVRQRGDIDCGGAEFVLVRYGHFYQFITPIVKGHISVCIEPKVDSLQLIERIQNALNQSGLK